jgi:hypothetical protein
MRALYSLTSAFFFYISCIVEAVCEVKMLKKKEGKCSVSSLADLNK